MEGRRKESFPLLGNRTIGEAVPRGFPSLCTLPVLPKPLQRKVHLPSFKTRLVAVTHKPMNTLWIFLMYQFIRAVPGLQVAFLHALTLLSLPAPS
jgi:hypothetical protein